MSKLYESTRAEFRLPYGANPVTREALMMPAGNLPVIFWPNNRWCLPANQFILELYDRGLSRQGIGGSILTYAANITHLVRFCFKLRRDFHELSDAEFTVFIRELRDEKLKSGERKRSDNHVLAIAYNCFDFLYSVAQQRQDEGLLGRDGRVRAYRQVISPRDGKALRHRWKHTALPMPDPKRRRHPIGTDDVLRLRAAVLPASKTIEQRRRRYVMLRCLEITGGRRIEIAALRVRDVIGAIKSPNHSLRIMTAKRLGGKPDEREIPCSVTDLMEIWNFVKTARHKIIGKTIGHDQDHGILFVSHRTGAPLRPNTITQEIHALARHAALKYRAAPHMFRHRYLTKVFVALIQANDLKTPKELRRALIGLEGIKRQLMEWSGHRSMESLDHYIDLAFAEVDQLQVTANPIASAQDLESLRYAIASLATELTAAGSTHISDRLVKILGSSNVIDQSILTDPNRGSGLPS